MNDVLITRAPISYSTLERPALLDMAPSTTTFTDAALRVGSTFTDAAGAARGAARRRTMSSSGEPPLGAPP